MAGRLLVLNADDYGLTPSVSAGIRHAHRLGLVTSTTAMLNLPGAEAELARARAECPHLGLGVHLVLTKGQPRLPPSALPSLVNLGDGSGLPSLAQFLAGLNQLSPAEVLAEWRAQVAAFVHATGQPPTHLDSHHHTAIASPALFDALLTLATEVGCAIRVPLTAHDPAQRHLGLPNGQAAAISRHVRARLAASLVPHPDHFEARFYGNEVSAGLLSTHIAGLREGVTELMCHPGLPDAALAAVSSYHHQRAQELEALTAPGLRAAVAAAGVRLAHFGSLAASGSMAA